MLGEVLNVIVNNIFINGFIISWRKFIELNGDILCYYVKIFFEIFNFIEVKNVKNVFIVLLSVLFEGLGFGK